jgi:ABC-2 type transport system ATP-binding protein
VSSAIVAKGVVKTFGGLRALDGVDLEVPEGALFGFLGPNGAGKSTMVRILTGLLEPTEGQALVLGIDVSSRSLDVRRNAGVIPDFPHLFERLSGREYLSFLGRIHNLAPEVVDRRTNELLIFTDLSDAADRLITDYSHGMKKKIALCGALLHGPRVLFLDEPFEGIDPGASIDIRNLLLDLTQKGVTIFLTSHVLEIVERLCTHVAVLIAGKVAASGLREEMGKLEPLFLELTGKTRSPAELDWFGR